MIAGIDGNSRSAAIAAALIGLCKELGLGITAEGIERQEQFAVLSQHRSILLQGYLISRPLPQQLIMTAKRTIPGIMQDLLLTVPAVRSHANTPDLRAMRSLVSASTNG